MRSANQAQIAGLILVEEYLGISSARVLRKLSVVKSLVANPMMANCLESRSSAARLQSAGMSFRLVRSPVAPKMTMTQGEATVFIWAWFMSGCPVQCHGVVRVEAFGRLRLLFRMTAELKTHGRQKLCGEFPFATRREALVERFAQHRSRRAGLYGGENRPAAFAGVRDAAGETLERWLLEKRNRREVEQPGSNDAAAAPDFGDIGEVEIVLVMFRIAQRRGFGIGLVMLLADIGVLE